MAAAVDCCSAAASERGATEETADDVICGDGDVSKDDVSSDEVDAVRCRCSCRRLFPEFDRNDGLSPTLPEEERVGVPLLSAKTTPVNRGAAAIPPFLCGGLFAAAAAAK